MDRDPYRCSSRRFIGLLALAWVAAVTAAGLLSSAASADTAPSIAAITPNTVATPSCGIDSDSCPGVTLDVTGDGFTATSTIQWRGVDYPVIWGGDTTNVSVGIPGSALAIAEPFLTVDVTLTTGSVPSNPRPVTILGPGVTGAQSATAGAGGTVTVETNRLSATYTRAAAGFGTVTAADYAFPNDPLQPGDPLSPAIRPVTSVAFVDLQLRSAGVGDSLVGTFVPPNPILPPNPVLPPNPILPPSPIRLAYWTGSAWAPVLGNGGAAPSFSFDYATGMASSATVAFSETSAPQIGALGGTIFAFVASYAFAGFADPVENTATNIAKAGRAVPLKWRVLDLGGNPVSNLSSSDIRLSSTRVDCGGLPGEEEPLDAYASGASGLQNLGDGYYQWNWTTESAWKGTCRRLQLDLGDKHPDGTPAYRTADFVFTR